MQLSVSGTLIALVFSSILCMSISNAASRTETTIDPSTFPEPFVSQVFHLVQSSSLLYYHGQLQQSQLHYSFQTRKRKEYQTSVSPINFQALRLYGSYSESLSLKLREILVRRETLRLEALRKRMMVPQVQEGCSMKPLLYRSWAGSLHRSQICKKLSAS